MSISTDRQSVGADRDYTPDPSLHHGLVLKIAKSFLPRAGSLDYEDLVQAGSIGLMIACQRYDPSLGYKISTYADKWIKLLIRQEIMDHGFFIRIPRYQHNRQRENVGEAFREAGRRAFGIRVLTGCKMERISDDEMDRCELADELGKLGAAMGRLSPRERSVITNHFGLGGRHSRTLRNIAKWMGLSYCQVRDSYVSGMLRLKLILSEGR